MAVTRSDMYFLSTDVTFQHRVQSALLLASISIATENAVTVPFHRERAQFVTSIIGPNGSINYVLLFSNTVATDSNVIGDATQAGTVVLSSANVASQAALVTDAHIDGAIAAQFNAFIRMP